jgi:hypothetical protein
LGADTAPTYGAVAVGSNESKFTNLTHYFQFGNDSNGSAANRIQLTNAEDLSTARTQAGFSGGNGTS